MTMATVKVKKIIPLIAGSALSDGHFRERIHLERLIVFGDLLIITTGE